MNGKHDPFKITIDFNILTESQKTSLSTNKAIITDSNNNILSANIILPLCEFINSGDYYVPYYHFIIDWGDDKNFNIDEKTYINGNSFYMSVSNSSYIYNNDVVCHTYDLTNSTTKSFTISIYGICEFLGFANFLSTAISGSNQITKNKQYFINPSKLITKIESFGDIGFYTYYYLFSGLTNLKNLPAADKCKLPIPSTGLGTIQNKKLLSYASLFRYCTKLQSIDDLKLPDVPAYNLKNTISEYNLMYMFMENNSLTGIPDSFFEQITETNNICWSNTQKPNFIFKYSNLFSSTSNKYTLQNRRKYGYECDSFNFNMYPDEKGENGANNKMVDAAGNQISALVQYVYPAPDNTSAYFIYPRYNVDDLFFTNVFFKPCIFDINKYAQRCNNR